MEKSKKYVTNLCGEYKYQSLISSESIKEVNNYTTLETFTKLIEHKKLRFSNDSSDGKYALDLCISKIDDIWSDNCNYKKQKFVDSLKLLSNKLDVQPFKFYKASFSLDKDNLSIWNDYAKEYEISINFSKEILLNSLRSQIQYEVVKPIAFLHGNMIYDEEKQVEILKEVLSDFSETDQHIDEWYKFAPMAIFVIGMSFKPYKFHEEQEYRIAFNLYHDFKDGSKCLSAIFDKQNNEAYSFKKCEKENMQTSYVDIYFDCNAIQAITLVPQLDTCSEADIKKLLQKHGMNADKIKIKKSSKLLQS